MEYSNEDVSINKDYSYTESLKNIHPPPPPLFWNTQNCLIRLSRSSRGNL